MGEGLRGLSLDRLTSSTRAASFPTLRPRTPWRTTGTQEACHSIWLSSTLPPGGDVARALLAPGAFPYEEPLNLMRREVTKAGMYGEVMSAIANDKTTNGEIVATVGVRTSDLTYYLRGL